MRPVPGKTARLIEPSVPFPCIGLNQTEGPGDLVSPYEIHARDRKKLHFHSGSIKR